MTNNIPAAAWSPELSPELRAAVAAAEDAAAKSGRIEEAIRATREQLATAESHLEATRSALAVAESDTALDGSPADLAARKAMIKARDEAEFVAARLNGLDARHKLAAGTLLEARRSVAIHWRNWQRAQGADYIDRIYVPALEQFVAAIRGATAVAAALNHNRLNAIARHTVLCDPADPERNPANPRRTNWQSEPVHQRLRDLAATVRPHLAGFEDAPMEMTDAVEQSA